MIPLIIVCIVFILLFVFPFMLSKRIKYNDGMEKSLVVKNDNVKDARYFSNSFRQLMAGVEPEKIPEKGQSVVEKVKLSKSEDIIFCNGIETLGEKVENICYICDNAEFKVKAVFEKEVYASGNVEFAGNTVLRAVAGEKNVIIGENSEIQRWADGKLFTVIKKGTNAGKSVSSGERLIIEPNCRFTRMYAPVTEVRNYVRVSDSPCDETVINREAPVYMKIKRNVSRVERDQEFRYTIITIHDLTVEAGAVVYGDLKSDGSIHIKNNAVVTGNVFADGFVIIEQGARVLGNVFASENLYIGPDVTIGKTGRIKSAISRLSMVISEGSVIYGYAGCENIGKIIERRDFAGAVEASEGIVIDENDIVVNKNAGLFEGIKCNISADGFLNLDNLEDYEQTDYYAFRNSDKLTGVRFPEGATEIKNSMFYGCDALETVIIPESVERIGDYAFFGCKSLKTIIFEGNSRLRKIGDYGFAMCESLDADIFSDVEETGYAAFWREEV